MRNLCILTQRELEVLLFVVAGYANADIAVQLEISEGTVKTHLSRIYSKLGANNRTHAANIARLSNLLRQEEIPDLCA